MAFRFIVDAGGGVCAGIVTMTMRRNWSIEMRRRKRGKSKGRTGTIPALEADFVTCGSIIGCREARGALLGGADVVDDVVIVIMIIWCVGTGTL